ncbi:MAG: two pore domain potassium channel family protein [Deltaproteobacteria bacterium]|nr:two pore domain potassium channel family protein [Candidatus Anaeroferrophillus wilburensis]MBN2890057.1 two pore domain potassium channel family protein [Deltaproteobacteria bacterium]
MKEVQRRLQLALMLFLLVTAIGTVGFMVLEELSFIDAFYFNIVTMSTVGFGDIHPTSEVGRLFAVFLIIMGGAAFLGVIANATEMIILRKEAEMRMRKVNMVLGVFFAEVGNTLLEIFTPHDQELDKIKEHLLISAGWSAKNFAAARTILDHHRIDIDMDRLELADLRIFLHSKRDFLVGLMENPVLVEHEEFSELLLAVFHLLDEMDSRESLIGLPATDLKHLNIDINRAYGKLTVQWLAYLGHLRQQYPYLFSLAVRKNPFDPKANPIVDH